MKKMKHRYKVIRLDKDGSVRVVEYQPASIQAVLLESNNYPFRFWSVKVEKIVRHGDGGAIPSSHIQWFMRWSAARRYMYIAGSYGFDVSVFVHEKVD